MRRSLKASAAEQAVRAPQLDFGPEWLRDGHSRGDSATSSNDFTSGSAVSGPRRHLISRTVAEADPRTHFESTVTDKRGEVRILLKRVSQGVYMERRETGPTGAQTLQMALFEDRRDFSRWCGSDQLRFSHPVLLHQVERDGQTLWDR